MKHKYKECECHNIDCPICQGGLAICEICKAIECELTTECPGFPLNNEELKLKICKGYLDYKGGIWEYI